MSANIHAGGQIRAERCRLGLTQTAAAKLMGINRPNLSRLEHSVGRPRVKTIEALKRAGIMIMIAPNPRTPNRCVHDGTRLTVVGGSPRLTVTGGIEFGPSPDNCVAIEGLTRPELRVLRDLLIAALTDSHLCSRGDDR